MRSACEAAKSGHDGVPPAALPHPCGQDKLFMPCRQGLRQGRQRGRIRVPRGRSDQLTELVACPPSLAYRRSQARPVRLAVRTPASHVGNRGSIPLRGASFLIRLSFALGPTVPPPFCRVTGRRNAQRTRSSCLVARRIVFPQQRSGNGETRAIAGTCEQCDERPGEFAPAAQTERGNQLRRACELGPDALRPSEPAHSSGSSGFPLSSPTFVHARTILADASDLFRHVSAEKAELYRCDPGCVRARQAAVPAAAAARRGAGRGALDRPRRPPRRR